MIINERSGYMLRLSREISDKKANEIVKRFVNDRLISMMEEIMMGEMVWIGAMTGTLEGSDGDKSFEDLVDIAELVTDEEFAEMVALTYLPDDYPVEKANEMFFELYKLLKAKGEYVPDLAMEYLLYQIIYDEVYTVNQVNEDIDDGLFDEAMEELLEENPDYDEDFVRDIDDDLCERATTVCRIPEPDRTVVLKALKKEAEELNDPDYMDDDPEYGISLYEDLAMYEECCFWDTDFLLLDDMSEDEIAASTANDMLGIVDPRDPKTVNFPIKDSEGQDININVKLNMYPWDME